MKLLSSLFADEQVHPELLQKHARIRWKMVAADVIPLTAAEPDFPAPKEVTQMLLDQISDGYFFYCSPEGEWELRELVAEISQTRYGIRCQPEHVVLTPGTAAGIWLVVRWLCQPGDECILLDPVDLLFGLAIDSVGARRVYCRVDKNTGQLDLEQLKSLLSPRTRLICLCNPHNPLGLAIPKETLQAIGELALLQNVMVLADEVWHEIIYPPAKHVSLASLETEFAQHTLTLFGPSKTFGLSGLRIGFLVAPNEKIALQLRQVALQLGMAYSLTLYAQVGAVAALRYGWSWRDAFVVHLQQMRNYCVSRLNRIPGISCRQPDATYVLFPDISGLGMSSQAFADFLLAQARVAVVPGTTDWFGPGAEGNVRLSFATSRFVLAEALDRIEQAVTNYIS